MFTGIIEEVGKVLSVANRGCGSRVTIQAARVLEGTHVGDSIAVNGVCLTVAQMGSSSFEADVMPETMTRSAFSQLTASSPVNLERALQVGARLGGHFITGHIDGTARVTSVTADSEAHRITLSGTPDLTRFMVEKGSVTLEGISLTLTQVFSDEFAVSIIPHTFESTTLRNVKAGVLLNVECDMLGKYVERLLVTEGLQDVPRPRAGITAELLAENGF